MLDLSIRARRFGGALFFGALTLALVALAMLVLGPAGGADHKDGPNSTNDHPGDITDLYAFRSPADTTNLVVALGVTGSRHRQTMQAPTSATTSLTPFTSTQTVTWPMTPQ